MGWIELGQSRARLSRLSEGRESEAKRGEARQVGRSCGLYKGRVTLRSFGRVDGMI